MAREPYNDTHNALPAVFSDMPGLEYGGTVTIGRNYGSRVELSQQQVVIDAQGRLASHNPKAIAPHRAISRHPTRPRLSRYSIQLPSFVAAAFSAVAETPRPPECGKEIRLEFSSRGRVAPGGIGINRAQSTLPCMGRQLPRETTPSAPPVPPDRLPGGSAADAAGALMILQVSPAAPSRGGAG